MGLEHANGVVGRDVSGRAPRHMEGVVTTPVVVRDERLDNLSGQWLASRYQIGEVRAHGALCVVYDGHDAVLQRTVAIKVAPPESAGACREALAATGGVSYPAFLAIYDVIEQDERLYIAQEFIDGRPLADYLADGAPVRRGVALALQLAHAIAYAHQHDLTHGDLTLSAILIDRNAIAHINNMRTPPDWDYFSAMAASSALSGMGGSADETLAALRADEHLRDIWSVGLALWLLVSSEVGKPGQPGDVTARAVRDEVSPEIREVITRTLDLTHEQRFTSADALALALESLDDALSLDSSDGLHMTPLAIRAYREERERAVGLYGAALRPHRIIDYRDDELGDPSSYSAVTDPMTFDRSQTRPADDGRFAPITPRGQVQARPYDGRGAFADPLAREVWPGVGAAPAWPAGAPPAPEAQSVMRPWVWTLIGVALFVAFFLVGYLVFPQVKLF